MWNKKQLIITSPTTAREINPLGKRPEKPLPHMHQEFFVEYYEDLGKWQAAEDALNEYRITNVAPMYKGRMPVLKVFGNLDEYFIGDQITCEVNEETKTCIIL